MKDEQIKFLDDQIAKLEKLKTAREAQLRDPKWTDIRKQYEIILEALNRLDDLGESVTDHEGCKPYIVGNLFRIQDGVLVDKSVEVR